MGNLQGKESSCGEDKVEEPLKMIVTDDYLKKIAQWQGLDSQDLSFTSLDLTSAELQVEKAPKDFAKALCGKDSCRLADFRLVKTGTDTYRLEMNVDLAKLSQEHLQTERNQNASEHHRQRMMEMKKNLDVVMKMMSVSLEVKKIGKFNYNDSQMVFSFPLIKGGQKSDNYTVLEYDTRAIIEAEVSPNPFSQIGTYAKNIEVLVYGDRMEIHPPVNYESVPEGDEGDQASHNLIRTLQWFKQRDPKLVVKLEG